MSSIRFATRRVTETEYQIVDDWGTAFRRWFTAWRGAARSSKIVVLSDDNVWALYEDEIRAALAPLSRHLVPLLLPPGEGSKDFASLPPLVDTLVRHRVHRRDLLLCAGGGVCCDLGGLLALLYLRGLYYVDLPTSLMAQLDAAIGGKVGANFGLRKNLLGGFHQPVLTVIAPGFLRTLPQRQFQSALAEAVKVAIIRDQEPFLELLEKRGEALLEREPNALRELLERCLASKLDLLAEDPYELDLDRCLNLGHAVAHALERLPVMRGGEPPSHGEAVAIGLAATIRYAARLEICRQEHATRLLRILEGLGLPIRPGPVDRRQVRDQLSRIPEHRGGLFRLVVPAATGGVRILPDADPDLLLQCLDPARTAA